MNGRPRLELTTRLSRWLGSRKLRGTRPGRRNAGSWRERGIKAAAGLSRRHLLPHEGGEVSKRVFSKYIMTELSVGA